MSDDERTHSGADTDVQAFTLSVAEAAIQLGKSDDTIRRLIRAGDLPAMRVQGARTVEYRLRPEDVQDAQGRIRAYAGAHVGTHAPMHAPAPAHSSTPVRVDATDGARAVIDQAVRSAIAPLAERLERLAQELGRERTLREAAERALAVQVALLAESKDQTPARQTMADDITAISDRLIFMDAQQKHRERAAEDDDERREADADEQREADAARSGYFGDIIADKFPYDDSFVAPHSDLPSDDAIAYPSATPLWDRLLVEARPNTVEPWPTAPPPRRGFWARLLRRGRPR